MTLPLPLTPQDIVGLKAALQAIPYTLDFLDVQDMSHHHKGHTYQGWHLKVILGVVDQTIPLLHLHKGVYDCLHSFQNSIHSVHIVRVISEKTSPPQDIE